MIQKIRIKPLVKDGPEMNETQTAALSRLIIDHIRLARSSRETLGWLMPSVRKAGSADLNRLAPDIDGAAQTASVCGCNVWPDAKAGSADNLPS